jgi:single-stranded DNA-binding protein
MAEVKGRRGFNQSLIGGVLTEDAEFNQGQRGAAFTLRFEIYTLTESSDPERSGFIIEERTRRATAKIWNDAAKAHNDTGFYRRGVSIVLINPEIRTEAWLDKATGKPLSKWYYDLGYRAWSLLVNPATLGSLTTRAITADRVPTPAPYVRQSTQTRTPKKQAQEQDEPSFEYDDDIPF